MAGRIRQGNWTGALLAALVMALVAAGSATAGSLITGKKIKDSSITGRDIRNGSLDVGDLRARAVARMTAVDARTRVEATGRISLDGRTTAEVTATCPAGQVALGGGGSLTNNPANGSLVSSVPVTTGPDSPPTGWSVRMRAHSSVGPHGEPIADDEVVRAYAICSP